MADQTDDADDPLAPLKRWIWEVGMRVWRVTEKCPFTYEGGHLEADNATLEKSLEQWFNEGVPIEEASERAIALMAKVGLLRKLAEYSQYPEPPRNASGQSMGPPPASSGGFYQVIHQDVTVACYNSIYYHSAGEVVADLLKRIKTGEIKGKWGSDFVIWRDGRILAALHEPMQGTRLKVVRFSEDRNDPGGADHRHLPGWPTREQWIESGRGDLWFDKDNPENSAV